MRRYAPVIFAVLSALFVLERGINGGAFAGHAPQVVGLHGVAPIGAGAECLARDGVLQTLALAGVRLTPEETPFCTDRPDLTDWVLADEAAGPRHLAFDGQGCLAVWHPAVGCP
jgi:hypothetical protein